jgi:hypothetical protein
MHFICVFKSCIQMPDDGQYNQNVVAYIDETLKVCCMSILTFIFNDSISCKVYHCRLCSLYYCFILYEVLL